jgi:nucleoid-associated protein YgaU
MPSRNTLVWVGAAASAIVVAGASALYWTHPGFLWWNAAGAPVVATAPAEPKPQSPAAEPKPPTAPSTPPAVQAAAPPASTAPAPADKASAQAAATPSPLKPSFDAVNVDPSGDAVIAGRAAPNAKVELRDAGKTVAVATADAAGQFVIIPPAALAPGDHSLSLAANADKPQPAISSPVAVSVPAPPQAKVAAAPSPPAAKAPAPTASPGASMSAPSQQAMRTVATPPSPAGARVAIRSVEADAVGGLIAKGSAEPNATVRLYLNDADVADAKTETDGRWSLTIKHGMTPGGYLMRADEINPGHATVVASANTPFDYPDMSAAAPPAAAAAASPSAEQPSAASPADPVIDSVQTKRVVTGHTLWGLSKSYYGDPTHYPVIYEANKWEIHNPNLIYPGQVVVVPKSEPKP